jgi:hypothetical protein
MRVPQKIFSGQNEDRVIGNKELVLELLELELV